jgi:hypothetical protein
MKRKGNEEWDGLDLLDREGIYSVVSKGRFLDELRIRG